MLQRLKQYLLIAVVIGAFYYLLSHHILFSSPTSFDILQKTQLTLKNTFVSLKQIDPERLLRDDDLRDGGLGDLLVEKGMLSEQKLREILKRIDSD